MEQPSWVERVRRLREESPWAQEVDRWEKGARRGEAFWKEVVA